MTSIDHYMRTLAIIQAALGCPDYDIRVCVNPNWHRTEFYHAGGQRFYCSICERLNKWIRDYDHGNKTA